MSMSSLEETAFGEQGRLSAGLERRARYRKVAGSNPGRSCRRIVPLQGNFLCWLLIILRYPFHLRVTAVARNRSWSFCQNCRWRVTAKHVCTLRMWLCMKWHDMVHDCMVYTNARRRQQCNKTIALSLTLRSFPSFLTKSSFSSSTTTCQMNNLLRPFQSVYRSSHSTETL